MKKVLNRLFWIPTVILLALTILIMIGNQTQITTVYAQQGELDLKAWNSQQNILIIGGEWQIFDDQMIQDLAEPRANDRDARYVFIPHLFAANPALGGNPYGVATYKAQLSGLDPAEHYALQSINEVSAYRLMVNGKTILSSGTVGHAASDYRPEMKAKIGRFQSGPDGKAEILIEIANFSYNYGGFWKELQLGQDQVLTAYASKQDNIEIYLFASILILGFFLLGLFSINREFKPLLYFSLICILIAIRILLTNNKQFYDFIYPISWDTGTRLEFLTGYLALPLFGLFFNALGYVKKLKPLDWLFYMMIVTAVVIMVLAPNEFYMNLLPEYINLCVFSIAYFAFVVFQGLRKHLSGAVLILIGMAGLVPTILVDFYGKLTMDLLPFGIYFMLTFFLIVVIKNVFKIKAQHDFLEEAIMIDPLTGLKNRYYINKLMDRGFDIVGKSRHYILFFDLDKFKQINDTYGHAIGDAVLVESARRIKSCFQRESDIVCRYGGDEFIAFVTVTEQDGVIEQIIQRIQAHFDEPMIIQNTPYAVRISIGVSEYKQSDNLEKVIKASDNAMYQAKKTLAGGIVIVDGLVTAGE